QQLIAMLGTGDTEIDLVGNPPVAVMMVGLQGSGKTTTTAKLGLWLKKRRKRKVLMASLDVRRPAAQRQLAVLGEQAAIDTLVQNLYEALKMPRPEAGYVTIQWAKGSPLMIPLPASNS
ncbi:hypothetical protein LCGC14_2807670, partial [marine sediment metagenome]